MQPQNYDQSEEEYRQFLAYQQQQSSPAQQSAYGAATQYQGALSQYPGQHQSYPHPSASGHGGYSAGYEAGKYSGIVYDHLTNTFSGYYQSETGGFPPPPMTAQGGYAYSQTQQSSQFGQASAGSTEMHSYRALPSTPQSTIDTYISIIQLPESEGDASGSQPSSARSRRAYVCKWKGCPKAVNNDYFKSKDNARVHVHKHFGSDKLFECVIPTCRKQFASEDAAKRHRDTTDWKAYTCAVCQHAFARKDYRDWHQARCRK